MSLGGNINAYFVTTTASGLFEEVTITQDIAIALKVLQKHIPEDRIRQIKASDGFPLIASGKLSKEDVFIFDRFEGDFFNQIQSTNSLVIGPRCLISCLNRNEEIPKGLSPIYTISMHNLNITASGISQPEKENLRNLIQWMGGHYFQNFGTTTTHLISNTIKSTKYEHASMNGIPVMHVDWVQRVWERSCVDDVFAVHEEFDKYRLPIFFGTHITCTGLDTAKKNDIMRLVNENGGTYHRDFRSQLVDVLITKRSKTNSDKYQAALRYKKDILVPEWIFDSVERGFALPLKSYLVKSMKVSTPTKTDQTIANFTVSDHSNISRISMVNRKRTTDMTVNDTICSTKSDISHKGFAAPGPVASAKNLQKETLKKSTTNKDYNLILNRICPKEAKKAGTFLDGCAIYLSGFRSNEKEKLNRILNVGGATCYDVVDENLTHIIIGQLDNAELMSWRKNGLLTGVHVVHLEWLMESINVKQPASEAVFKASLPTSREPEAPSPSSKRTLRSMNRSFKQPSLSTKKKLFETSTDEENPTESDKTLLAPVNASAAGPEMEEDVNHLIAQYSHENIAAAALPPPVTTQRKTDRDMTLGQPLTSSTQYLHNETKKTNPELNAPSIVAPLSSKPDQPAQPTQAVYMINTLNSTIDYEKLNFFQNLVIYIAKDHFPEFYTQMISECEAAHGNVVSDTFRDTVDYAIVSFERTLDESMVPVKARHIITELYVESCMKENKLVPIEYYHNYIPITANSMPLQGLTVVVSIYTGLERDFIDSLANLLGATVNKTFIKKEKPILVCPLPEGSKYEGAIKWQYPVVTVEWLVQCANVGEKLSFSNFLVGNSPSDFPKSPPIKEVNPSQPVKRSVGSFTPESVIAKSSKNANTPNVPKTPNSPNTPIASTISVLPKPVSTNAKAKAPLELITPLRNKRVSELAGVCTTKPTAIDSPHTPTDWSTRPSYNFGFMETILSEIEDEAQRECVREVILEMQNNQTPELERIKRQACTPINRKIPTPKGIPTFCTTPEFEKRMADEFEKRWRLPLTRLKPNTPIEAIRRRVIRATCEAMGIPYDGENDDSDGDGDGVVEAVEDATVNANLTKTITTNQTSRRSNIATPVNSKHMSLAPRTILTPNSSSNRPESLSVHKSPRISDVYVPATQTPNNSTRQSPMDSPEQAQRTSIAGKSTINFDKLNFDDTTLNPPNRSETTTESPEIKQISEYLRNFESRRENLKRCATLRDQMAHREIMNSEQHYVQAFESEQFGIGTDEMVGWRDPAEFDIDRRNRFVATKQHDGIPYFSISCSEELRDDIISKILKLGGNVSENLVNFDPECTHFVCERPNRGEKMLSCISSGKWVLSLKYIEESFAKDTFVDEELYEWGNCKALNLPSLTPEEQVIAQAGHRWRKELYQADGTDGAFSGFRAILMISERNMEALKTVIKAGRGQVLNVKSPFSERNGAQLATHCFVDIKKVTVPESDLRFLRDHNINILSQMYINSYLMYGRDADFEKYKITT